MYMWNMKDLPLLVKKLWPRLKFCKSRSNVKVKVTRSKILVPMERSCHKEYTCEIWKLYVCSWVIGKVKVFVHPNANADAGGYNNSSPDIRPDELKIHTHIINTSEDMSQVKVLWRTDRQTDGQEDEWILMSHAFVKGGGQLLYQWKSLVTKNEHVNFFSFI